MVDDEVASVLSVHWRAGEVSGHDKLYLGGVSPVQVDDVLQEMLMAWGGVSSPQALARDSLLVLHVECKPSTQAAALLIGRWYPAQLFKDVPEGVRLVQLKGVEGMAVTVDCNHPLADADVRFEVVSAASLPSSPGRLELPLRRKMQHWLFGGVGLQAYPLRDLFDSDAARTRQDVANDAVFYSQPRLVQHIDAWARGTISQWYAAAFAEHAEVLDLMSSWVTHIPLARDDLHVDGLGMNEYELSSNTRLRNYFVHDLNSTPDLPVVGATYDGVVCSVSVEYLTDPVAVFASVAAVLGACGSFANAFSNRCFPTKAIALWGQLQPFERMAFVADLYAKTGAYGPCFMQSMSGAPRPPEDDYVAQLPDADPVYLVTANTNAPCPQSLA